ncbi:chitinase [Streptomyces sp. JJ36]|nr:chitinase [Streptomyces sp. JJ36]
MTNTSGHRRRRDGRSRLTVAAAAAGLVATGGLALAAQATAGEDGTQGGAGAGTAGSVSGEAAAGGADTGGTPFAPYADTSLRPAYDLVEGARRSGAEEFTLAFVTSSGGCEPRWGGRTGLGDDPVAAQIDELRAAGGEVRVSFGGAAGTELALACDSAEELAEAYGTVVETYGLTAVDFDVEGGALPDTAANTRRAEAIAELQRRHEGLDVSFTLPVMPEGLTPDGVALLENAVEHGVDVSEVNIMAMDYGPAYTGDMGAYAVRAATATQAQLKKALGLPDDAAAWSRLAVTPMIGVNDVRGEVFTLQDAGELKRFADERGLARLSMWSATRDTACPGGEQPQADPTCSGIRQEDFAFGTALAP